MDSSHTAPYSKATASMTGAAFAHRPIIAEQEPRLSFYHDAEINSWLPPVYRGQRPAARSSSTCHNSYCPGAGSHCAWVSAYKETTTSPPPNSCLSVCRKLGVRSGCFVFLDAGHWGARARESQRKHASHNPKLPGGLVKPRVPRLLHVGHISDLSLA